MLRLIPLYPATDLRASRGVRCRIIGCASDSKLLIQVNTLERTSVELVSPDGSSKTVVSFKKYMDLVSADLSPDFEFIHLTERISSENGFAFSSVVLHIYTLSVSKLFVSESPISAFFLHSSIPCTARLLHIVGSRLTDLRVTMNKPHLSLEKIRGGLHMRNIYSYSFIRNKNSIILIHDSSSGILLTEFRFHEDNVMSKTPVKFPFPVIASLPCELALSPLSQLHLPFFHMTENRIFVTSYDNKVCCIQQTYSDRIPCCSFSIAITPASYTDSIKIQNVPNDMPINFYQSGQFILVYIINYFITILDISVCPPIVMQVPPDLAKSNLINSTTSNLLFENMIVHNKNGQIYQASLDFSSLHKYTPYIFKDLWIFIADYSAFSLDSEMIAGMFWALQQNDSPYEATNVIAVFFSHFISNTKSRMRKHSKSQLSKSAGEIVIESKSLKSFSLSPSTRSKLEEIENQFPSSSHISRTQTFWTIVNSKKDITNACLNALQLLINQNHVVTALQHAIEKWLEVASPTDLWKYIIFSLIEMKTENLAFPAVPCLHEQLGSISPSVCPEEIKKILNSQKKKKESIEDRFYGNDSSCLSLESLYDSESVYLADRIE